jgi:hypothetical protein
MTRRIQIILFCLLVSACWLLPAQAEEPESEGIARVVLIKPKEGHGEALLEAITGYHKWVAQFEGHQVYQWYEILSGPETGNYIARTANHNWADFDASHDWQEQAGENFDENVAPHIQDADVWYTQEMRDFSNWPESFDGYTHYNVESWYVKNGQYGKFRRGLKQIVDTLKAEGFSGHWGFFSVPTGGHGGQIELVSANKGWSDMSEPDPDFFSIMSESLGGAEAFDAFMSDWGSTFKSGPSRMVKYMPKESDYSTE